MLVKHDLETNFPDKAVIYKEPNRRLFEQLLIMLPQLILMLLVDKIVYDLFAL